MRLEHQRTAHCEHFPLSSAQLDRQPARHPGRRALYQGDHWTLVDALRKRELARAVSAMRAHLERVRVNLLGAAEGDTSQPPTPAAPPDPE